MNQHSLFFGAAGNLGWALMRRVMNAVQKQTHQYHQ